jgi:hypothetical protein
MDYFAGLDVSVKDTSVCIVDGTGKIVREVKVASEPQALLAVLRNATYCFKRIGLEAGPLSQWLYGALAEARLPVICVETQIVLVRTTKWSWLKAWAMQIARRRGMKRAIVALARRLAVIMHRIWVDDTEFRWTRNAAAA